MNAEIELNVIKIQNVEGVTILGIADDLSDPANYLIFQKPAGAKTISPENVHTELNDQNNSAYGAISEIEIQSRSIDIRLNSHGARYLGRDCIFVGFDEGRHEEVAGVFRSFFEHTGTRLIV